MSPENEWVDQFCPSTDWQQLARPYAVLPVGSCEQHGDFMPLATDALEVEYFARHVAREIQAALLPTLPIFQSFEHTGFRGSLSLRPETAMAMIRDLVDELERQNFTRVILLNGHGGNFALAPVVRDINRLDRPIKIILLNFWEFDESEEGQSIKQGEIHSAGWETSLMLALHPELVREQYARAKPIAGLEGNVRQSDLNLFGFGTVRPAGFWGQPERADQELGRAIVASIEKNLVNAVQERLGWLDKQSAYGGKGAIVVRPMENFDLARGLELSTEAGWNQRLGDWALFHACNPRGCFVAQHNGRVVGTVTSIDYAGRCSWIGMVLVAREMRRRGIGTQLLQAALDQLADCACVKLDATPAGRELYRTLGFEEESRLLRMTGTATTVVNDAVGNWVGQVRPMTADDLAAVVQLDAEVFGVSRPEVIQGLFELGSRYAMVGELKGQGVVGFALVRRGRKFLHLGPLTAADPAAAQALADAVLRRAAGHPVLTDACETASGWIDWLTARGFVGQRPFIRMFRGASFRGHEEWQYSISGPELG